jgi:hypothetical protein
MMVIRSHWFKTTVALAFATLISGCQLLAEQSSAPATVIDATEKGMLEIKQVIGKALNSDSILFATEVLTERSIIAIENGSVRSIDKPNVMGRNEQLPHRFQLLKKGGNCLLKRLGTDQVWQLEQVKCEIISSE